MHVGVVAFLGRPLGDVVVLGTEHVTSPNYLQHTIITPHTKLDGFARISRLYFLDPRGVPIPSRPPGEGLPHLLGTWAAQLCKVQYNRRLEYLKLEPGPDSGSGSVPVLGQRRLVPFILPYTPATQSWSVQSALVSHFGTLTPGHVDRSTDPASIHDPGGRIDR